MPLGKMPKEPSRPGAGKGRLDPPPILGGDYRMLSSTHMILGELLSERVGLSAGEEVLDVATGTGNTALAAARRLCNVTGVDLVPPFLTHARQRASLDGLQVQFIQANAENLPFGDASFDVVLSTLGVMFVKNYPAAAREMLRVCRPGGRIGLVNWTPDSWAGDLERLMQRGEKCDAHSATVSWGTQQGLETLLDGVSEIRFRDCTFLARHRSPESYWEFFSRSSGLSRVIGASRDSNAQDKLYSQVIDLIRRRNRAKDGTVLMPQQYLEVIATIGGQ